MSKLLIDVTVLLAICDAVHGNGDLSAIDTADLRAFVDGELSDATEKAAVQAELDNRE